MHRFYYLVDDIDQNSCLNILATQGAFSTEESQQSGNSKKLKILPFFIQSHYRMGDHSKVEPRTAQWK